MYTIPGYVPVYLNKPDVDLKSPEAYPKVFADLRFL